MQEKFKTILARNPAAVVVVLTQSAGITINSFVALSLEPPLISFAIGKSSLRFNDFVAADRFTINFLSEADEGIARHYVENKNLIGVKFVNNDDLPVLTSSRSYLVCAKTSAIDVGDHTLLIANVNKMNMEEDNIAPLLYHNRQYKILL